MFSFVTQSARVCCVKGNVTNTLIPEGGQTRRISRFSRQLVGDDRAELQVDCVKDGALAHQIM